MIGYNINTIFLTSLSVPPNFWNGEVVRIDGMRVLQLLTVICICHLYIVLILFML